MGHGGNPKNEMQEALCKICQACALLRRMPYPRL
jgi:hypothetical protein